MVLKTIGCAAAGVALALASSVNAHATAYDYDYTGNNFNAGNTSGVYTTNDHLTISLQFSSALADNLVNVAETPTGFNFSDGVDTITNNSSGLYDQQFYISTDAAGQITAWTIGANLKTSYSSQNDASFDDYIFSSNVGIAEDEGHYADGSQFGQLAYTEFRPGTWTETELASSVPEVSTWIMIMVGFCGFGFLHLLQQPGRSQISAPNRLKDQNALLNKLLWPDFKSSLSDVGLRSTVMPVKAAIDTTAPQAQIVGV